LLPKRWLGQLAFLLVQELERPEQSPIALHTELLLGTSRPIAFSHLPIPTAQPGSFDQDFDLSASEQFRLELSTRQRLLSLNTFGLS
jgi:hypothetical protein